MLRKLVLIILFCSSSLFAAKIEILDAYVRAVPPKAPNSALFMKIKNTSDKELSLLSVNSLVAKKVELHDHIMHKGMMKMQQISKISIPAKSQTNLEPGGLHIMLLGLKKPLRKNETIEVELNFSNSQTIKLNEVPIKSVLTGMKRH